MDWPLQKPIDPPQGTGGGIAAKPGVFYFVGQARFFYFLLDQSRLGISFGQTVTGGDTIAEKHDRLFRRDRRSFRQAPRSERKANEEGE